MKGLLSICLLALKSLFSHLAAMAWPSELLPRSQPTGQGRVELAPPLAFA